MLTTKQLQKKLKSLLPSDYRKQVVDRLREKGIEVHPNTVYNVLHGKHTNIEVANEIVELATEQQALHKQMDKNLKQLSAA